VWSECGGFVTRFHVTRLIRDTLNPECGERRYTVQFMILVVKRYPVNIFAGYEWALNFLEILNIKY
jgi:hypothetical protein